MTGDSGRDDDVRIGSEGEPPGGDVPAREILELDHVFDALSHPRRRYLCYTLLEDTEWSLTELAAKIAAWENDVPEHAVSDQQRERTYVSLYHAHVPNLVEDGIVSFEGETESITAGENAAQVLTALRAMGASLDATQEAHARGEMDDGNQ